MKTPVKFPVSSRRQFLQTGALASAAIVAPVAARGENEAPDSLPGAFDALKPLGSRVKPIAADEFRQRVERAQRAMAEAQAKFDALFLAPGTGLYYFSGIRWWPSERLLALVIPRSGEPIIVVPGFEEGRMRERLKFAAEV